jgi:hypothetical protein
MKTRMKSLPSLFDNSSNFITEYVVDGNEGK